MKGRAALIDGADRENAERIRFPATGGAACISGRNIQTNGRKKKIS